MGGGAVSGLLSNEYLLRVSFFFFFEADPGYKLGFWIFSRIRFFEFFFFGGVIAGYYIAPLAPTKKVVLCEAVTFFFLWGKRSEKFSRYFVTTANLHHPNPAEKPPLLCATLVAFSHW